MGSNHGSDGSSLGEVGAVPAIIEDVKCVVNIHYTHAAFDKITLDPSSPHKEVYTYLKDQAASLYRKFNGVRKSCVLNATMVVDPVLNVGEIRH